MASPRVTSRPPAPSRGTGTGTGGTPGTVSGLPYDRYLGTLGLATEALAGAKYPHYTGFPAANKGSWLSVVSTYKADDLTLAKNFLVENGEIWICNTDNTIADNPANWQRIIPRQKFGVFESIGFFFLGRYDTFVFPTNIERFVRFNENLLDDLASYYIGIAPTPTLVQVGETTIVDITKWKNYAASYGIDLYIDAISNVFFAADGDGDRGTAIGYGSGTMNNGVFQLNKAGGLDNQTVIAVRGDITPVRANVEKLKIAWDAPKNPTDILTHGIYVTATQTSGISLPIELVNLTIAAYKKNG
jgi:hypothetical protein